MAIRRVQKTKGDPTSWVDRHVCDRCGSTRDLKERDVDGRRYVLCEKCRIRLGPMAGVSKAEP